MRSNLPLALVVVCSTLGSGCGSGTGSVAFSLRAEDGARGISPSSDEPIVDGWTVAFTKYVVAVGRIELAGGGPAVSDATVVVADLTQVGSGLMLTTLEDLDSGAWPELHYSTPIADATAERDESVSLADFDRMVSSGCTYLIAGVLTHPEGQSCARGDRTMCRNATRLEFEFCVPAPTEFGPCESDTGIEGVNVVDGQTTTATLSIHSDHLFFNGFPMGAEGSVRRRAQWLADSDLDADGAITQGELESISAADFGTLFPADTGDGEPGYDLSGASVEGGLGNAWQYVQAQLQTQGHFQGEGECAINGSSHSH